MRSFTFFAITRLCLTAAMLATGFFVAASPSIATADLILEFLNDAGSSAANQSPTSEAPGSSTTDIQLSNTSQAGSQQFSGDQYQNYARISGTTSGATVNDDLANALAEGTYFSFTITPDAGQVLSIDDISFDAVAATGDTTSNRSLFLFSDLTGFNTGDLLLGANTLESFDGNALIPFNSASADVNFLEDLSAVSELQNITSSVEFRVYLRSPNTFQSIGFDDITVNGTLSPVGVPEPSSLTLGFVSLLLALKRQRS